MSSDLSTIKALKDAAPLSKNILSSGLGPHVLSQSDQRLLGSVMRDVTKGRPGIDLRYLSSLIPNTNKVIGTGGFYRLGAPGQPLQQFPKESINLFLNPKNVLPGTKHIDDLAFTMAHESGHADDFYRGAARGNVNRWAAMSSAEKEYVANEKAMRYLADRDMKVGPKYKETFTDPKFKSKYPRAYHHMPKMAARFGILPMFAGMLAPILIESLLDSE